MVTFYAFMRYLNFYYYFFYISRLYGSSVRLFQIVSCLKKFFSVYLLKKIYM